MDEREDVIFLIIFLHSLPPFFPFLLPPFPPFIPHKTAMLKNYLKIAIRNLTRNKIFSVINIAGLSLGLTCCMLIVLYTKDEVSFDRFQANKDHLYRVMVTSRTNMKPAHSGVLMPSTGLLSSRIFPM
jgi:hypothetical protein